MDEQGDDEPTALEPSRSGQFVTHPYVTSNGTYPTSRASARNRGVSDLLETVLGVRANDASVARPVLGAMNFGKRTPEAEATSILARAFERGVVHVDTANAYTDGASERIVGAFARGRRERLVVATKCGFGRIAGKPEGLSRARILEACDASLGRLGSDYVDVYYLHVPDRMTPMEESLDALAELYEKKKIRAWGISNYAAWQVLEMFPLAEARGLPRPAVGQQLYNVLMRQLEVEYLPFARKYGVHTTVYNPLAGGLLSGRHARDGSTQAGSRFDKNKLYLGRYFTDGMFDRLDALLALAREGEMSLVALAYGWLTARPGVDTILLGPGTVAQLDEGLDACARPLPAPIAAKVDALHHAWRGTDTDYVR